MQLLLYASLWKTMLGSLKLAAFYAKVEGLKTQTLQLLSQLSHRFILCKPHTLQTLKLQAGQSPNFWNLQPVELWKLNLQGSELSFRTFDFKLSDFRRRARQTGNPESPRGPARGPRPGPV